MPSDSSPRRKEDLRAGMMLVRALDDGHLDCLQCPRCGRPRVSVWFTNPVPAEYRTWFVCDACGFTARFRNVAEPKHFSADRIKEQLDRYDVDLIKRTVL
jgi:uncharacterized protein (DUF983 family)